jgi:hypothetical protein
MYIYTLLCVYVGQPLACCTSYYSGGGAASHTSSHTAPRTMRTYRKLPGRSTRVNYQSMIDEIQYVCVCVRARVNLIAVIGRPVKPTSAVVILYVQQPRRLVKSQTNCGSGLLLHQVFQSGLGVHTAQEHRMDNTMHRRYICTYTYTYTATSTSTVS